MIGERHTIVRVGAIIDRSPGRARGQVVCRFVLSFFPAPLGIFHSVGAVIDRPPNSQKASIFPHIFGPFSPVYYAKTEHIPAGRSMIAPTFYRMEIPTTRISGHCEPVLKLVWTGGNACSAISIFRRTQSQ